jgi:hypothetical protein
VILNSLRKNPPFFSAVSSPIEGPLPAISERVRVFGCVGTVSLASMPLGAIPTTQRVGKGWVRVGRDGWVGRNG